jgi:AmmeMemoRadiSam system protein B/AmmeMemoRadiSam system protein A
MLVVVSSLLPVSAGEPSRVDSKHEKIRRPAVAGMFYPGDDETLRRMVSDSLKAVKKEEFTQSIKAILSPHAGYQYCGTTLASAFKQIESPSFNYDTVILIGPSHRVATKAAALSSADAWETPLGAVPVDTLLARQFVDKNSRIEFDDNAHMQEHSLEVQLPYLMTVAGGKRFKIVPMLTNSTDPLDNEILAQALSDLAADPKTLIVISSDLSHYPSSAVAENVDKALLDAIKSLHVSVIVEENRKILKAGYPGLSVAMCGMESMLCVVRAAPRLGLSEARVVNYTNSGMAGGDNRRVVGYGAMIFTGSGKQGNAGQSSLFDFKFGEQSRQELLAMARGAAKAAVEGSWVSYDPSENPELQVMAGCFVTLKNNGVLRGCIGRFTSNDPLWKTVREVAVSSATRDTRFSHNPVFPAEIPQLEIEISVLSPMRKISRPLEEIELGRDGIVVQDRGRSGTFLPQVATETGWSLEEFLGHCASDKAGIGWQGWKSPTAQIFAYTATIIEEKKGSPAPDSK